MRERLATLLMALAALALFWLLFFPKPRLQPPATRPLSDDAGTEGYAALARWLSAAHVPVRVLHQRYDQLDEPAAGLAPAGNLLVATLPYAVALNAPERGALQRWVGDGNTLLLIAALDDTPRWSASAGQGFPALLQQLALVQFTLQPSAGADAAQQARELLRQAADRDIRTELYPAGRHPLLAGVSRMLALSALPSSQWRAAAMDSAPLLELARGAGQGALWLRPLGQGAIVVSAYASPFANALLGSADNARFLSNLVAWSLRPGGRVILDDAHQGALAEYDAAAFYSDPRLHGTLWWLVGLWLAWVLASQPLRPAAARDDRPDEAAMLQLSAGFFASVLTPATAARALLAEFFDRLRQRLALPPGGQPPWEWLGAQAPLGRLLPQLRQLHARAEAGERIDLMRLQTVIAEVSGRIS